MPDRDKLSTREEYYELVERSFDWYSGELSVACHCLIDTPIYNDRHIALLIETHSVIPWSKGGANV